MDYVLGIDLGTSFFKFMLVDSNAQIRAISRRSVPTRHDGSGRSEVLVSAFRKILIEGVTAIARSAGIQLFNIRAVSYSSQANSFLLLGADGQPLTPIILWSDHRVDTCGEAILSLWDRDDYLSVTGLGFKDRELAIAKLDWFRREMPDLWNKATHVVTLSDFLGFLLTGTLSGDESTASLLGMWDQRNHRWWSEALDALGSGIERLAQLYAPGTVVGSTCGQLARDIGLADDALFAVGALDHYAAALGGGVDAYADASESTGTVLAYLHLVQGYQPGQYYCTGPTEVPDRYYRIAFGPNGAGWLEWFQRNLARDHSFNDLADIARRAPPGASEVFAPPGGYRGDSLSIFACPAGHTPTTAECVRAMMESTALSLDRIIDKVSQGRRPDRVVSVGGGSRSETWMQIKANMLGMDVLAGRCPEAGCVGAAVFASVAAGWHSDVPSAVRTFASTGRRFSPKAEVHEYYLSWKRRYPWNSGSL